MRFWFFSKRESSKPPTYQTKLTSFEKNCDNVRRSLSIVLIKKNYDPPFFTDQMKVVTEIKYITFLLLAV